MTEQSIIADLKRQVEKFSKVAVGNAKRLDNLEGSNEELFEIVEEMKMDQLNPHI